MAALLLTYKQFQSEAGTFGPAIDFEDRNTGYIDFDPSDPTDAAEMRGLEKQGVYLAFVPVTWSSSERTSDPEEADECREVLFLEHSLSEAVRRASLRFGDYVTVEELEAPKQ